MRWLGKWLIKSLAPREAQLNRLRKERDEANLHYEELLRDFGDLLNDRMEWKKKYMEIRKRLSSEFVCDDTGLPK